ncbi:uncharacterized protein PAC_06958 [Phialocephala subalpina]|uniref:Uncharacterized protein n=1 Tax=Phialocephala subalpina TaxID=576137 RepID=A0A1L7WWD2_9HELO|nr:uncharacterized protein PAC_06958 [Phialocephala subalpina]
MSLSRRTTYSLPAIKKYLTHIIHPSHHTTSLLQNTSKKEWVTSSDALKALTTLQKYQQAKIPFSNLYLHYSHHHLGTLEPAKLYEYIVDSGGIAKEGGIDASILSQKSQDVLRELKWRNATEREKRWGGRGPEGGRGGSCTLNNGFFGTMMRSLNLSVKSTGARVALSVSGGPKGIYAGWNHLVNLVLFDGKRYLVDVGFGGNGPTAPILLQDGNEQPWGVTGDRIRVIWKGIAEYETPGEKCWVLQHRREGNDWDDIYCFTEIEFTPVDVAVMNWKTTRDLRGSFFNYMVICVRNVMEGEDVVGTIILKDGKVKSRIRGNNETLRVCKSEVDRWEALEEYFGIVLGEQERMGIKGMVTELKGGPEDE